MLKYVKFFIVWINHIYVYTKGVGGIVINTIKTEKINNKINNP